MLTILPQVVKETDENKTVLFEAKEKDKLIGSLTASFRIFSDIVMFENIEYKDDDKFVADGLCRAALSYALNQGVVYAVFAALDNNISTLGYSEKMNIESFFNKNCKNIL